MQTLPDDTPLYLDSLKVSIYSATHSDRVVLSLASGGYAVIATRGELSYITPEYPLFHPLKWEGTDQPPDFVMDTPSGPSTTPKAVLDWVRATFPLRDGFIDIPQYEWSRR